MTESLFNGKKIAVMGLGKSGLTSVDILQNQGADLVAWDDNPDKRKMAAQHAIPIENLLLIDWTTIDILLWSPGIAYRTPSLHPVVEIARRYGINPVCDIELFVQSMRKSKKIAVTGTNGKSTTTTLITHLIQSCGVQSKAGGNLGIPALNLPDLGEKAIHVLEVSSYQADLLDKAEFDCVVLLNITPDHLSHHGSMQAYIDAKFSLFSHLKSGGKAIVGLDDDYCQNIAKILSQRSDINLITVSVKGNKDARIQVEKGKLIDQALDDFSLDLSPIATLQGQHNWQNAAISYATTQSLGFNPQKIFKGLQSFTGLEHRQEIIATKGHVTFINDSKATNADATEKALTCHDRIYWILGGQAKEGGITSLSHYFPKIIHAFLIGEASGEFAHSLEGHVSYSLCHTLDRAVTEAWTLAQKKPHEKSVILLSPACASWDQFNNFEHRGHCFRNAVLTLLDQKEAS
jgi:UDP-N-acetylmuramoylalanine--D-glutamate ligase